MRGEKELVEDLEDMGVEHVLRCAGVDGRVEHPLQPFDAEDHSPWT